MSVSVVIPTYNSGRFLCEAIESVLAQTETATEIIVVDDGSTDDTENVLKPYRDRITYIRQDNRGVSTARNKGVAAATGELVAFLDADDIWHPRKLELQCEAMRRNPEIGLLGTGAFGWPARSIPEVTDEVRGQVKPISWEKLVVKNSLWCSSVVARRSVLADVGEFDDALQGPEDRDLWIRVGRRHQVAVLQIPLLGYRDGVPGSVSKNARRCHDGMRRILGKLEADGALRRRPILRRRAYAYMCHACAYLYSCDLDYGAAVGQELRSLYWYPIPLTEADNAFARVRTILVAALRQSGAMPADPHAIVRAAGEGSAVSTARGCELSST